jgi:NDP-sugar pyrophosphorylase family protein
LWPRLIQDGRLAAFKVNERFYDIGTVERLKEFEEKVRDYFPNSVSH